MIDTVLTEHEVAHRLQINAATLQRWRKAGLGPPYFRIGRTYRYSVESLTKWIAQQERGSHNDGSHDMARHR